MSPMCSMFYLRWANMSLVRLLKFVVCRPANQSMVSYLPRGNDSDWNFCYWRYEQHCPRAEDSHLFG